MTCRLLFLVSLLLAAVLFPSTAAAQEGAAFCAAGQEPEWDQRLVPLAQQLGTFMGAPTECPHQDPATSNTLQATTTGLAYIQAGTNTPVFTNGQDHVALTGQGLMGWDGTSVDAPSLLGLPSGTLPTFCSAQHFSSSVSNGYLCAYPDSSVAAWAQTQAGADWLLLGTEAEAGANWDLTSAGQQLLGNGVPPATNILRNPVSTPQIASPTPPPTLALPSDSDLEVSLNPVSPAASVLVTGSACNSSMAYAATSVEIDFGFIGTDGLSTTPDHASYSIARLGPESCAQIVTSINTVYPWQSIEVSDTRVQWQRAA
jgi:hypothetical protein